MIKTIRYKDEEFFKMLYCCGVITEYGLQLMKVSRYKLNLYRVNNLIDVVYENGIKGYKLTSKSKKIMSKKYGLKKSYTYRSIRHCSKLQEIYLNLNLERYKWITENEALSLIEIISPSYRERDLNKKEKFLNILDIEAIFIKC